jgi:hypothetical protein
MRVGAWIGIVGSALARAVLNASDEVLAIGFRI